MLVYVVINQDYLYICKTMKIAEREVKIIIDTEFNMFEVEIEKEGTITNYNLKNDMGEIEEVISIHKKIILEE